jgi:hypothetical protein
MGSSLIIFVVMAGFAYFAFTRMKQMQGAAASSFAELAARLEREFTASRQPGESDAAWVSAGTHNTLKKNLQLMLAVTNQRLLLADPQGTTPMRSFTRNEVRIAAPRKRWTDTGNMQTTTSEGWEVSLDLPGGEKIDGLRLYGENAYFPQQAANVPPFLSAIGAA